MEAEDRRCVRRAWAAVEPPEKGWAEETEEGKGMVSLSGGWASRGRSREISKSE
jgi:hypothetical protein